MQRPIAQIRLSLINDPCCDMLGLLNDLDLMGWRFTKRNWVRFRNKIGDWQKAYMGRLCGEHIELLCETGGSSEKFC